MMMKVPSSSVLAALLLLLVLVGLQPDPRLEPSLTSQVEGRSQGRAAPPDSIEIDR